MGPSEMIGYGNSDRMGPSQTIGYDDSGQMVPSKTIGYDHSGQMDLQIPLVTVIVTEWTFKRIRGPGAPSLRGAIAVDQESPVAEAAGLARRHGGEESDRRGGKKGRR